MEALLSSVQEHLSAPLCSIHTQVYVEKHFCSLLLGLKQKKNPDSYCTKILSSFVAVVQAHALHLLRMLFGSAQLEQHELRGHNHAGNTYTELRFQFIFELFCSDQLEAWAAPLCCLPRNSFKIQCSTTGAMQIWSQTAVAHKES